MGLRTKIGDLRAGEHDTPPDAAGAGASLARRHEAALAAVKRELAAIVVVGALGAPAVVYWLDGLRELAVLGGYGIGGALWIHARARGLLLAVRQAERASGDGAHGP